MQHTHAPGLAPSNAERRNPSPPRIAPPAQVLELVDEQDFLRQLERECLHSRRSAEKLSVLCLEVQFETEVDEALRAELLGECARRLRSRVRSTDTVLRWQARHFAVFLQRCEATHAQAVLQRLTLYAGGRYRLDNPSGSQLLQVQLHGQLARCEGS